MILILVSVSSCKVTKQLPEGSNLLIRNQLKISGIKKGDELERMRGDLTTIESQKPNRLLFGFMPVKLWFYTVANKPKETKFRWWIKNKVGEAPSIYDSTLTDKTDQAMETYLFNYGYFHNNVTHQVSTKKRKTKVTYNITPGEPWMIGDVTYSLGNTNSENLVRAKTDNTVLKKGARFDINTLKAERDRIETDLKNAGYFFFVKEYVTYDLDTSTQQTVNIKVKINQPSDSTEHQAYKINNIYILTDYIADKSRAKATFDTIKANDLYFVAHKHRFSQKVLTNSIYFQKGDWYSKDNHQKTLKRLTALGAFKFVSIDFQKVLNVDSNYIDCIIYLTQAKRHTVSVQAEATVNSEGLTGTNYSGVATTFSYKNRNLFKGSDQLAVDLSAGIQFQFSNKEKSKLSTADFSTNITYTINRFLVPFPAKSFSKKFNPKTILNARYGYEKRFNFYTLHTAGFSFGYDWKNGNMRHLLNPVSATFFVLENKSDSFIRRLDSFPSLKRAFEEQFILGGNYTFIYNNQKTKNDRQYFYFRSSIDIAGNLLTSGFELAHLNQARKQPFNYTLFTKPFSQYARFEEDFRYYHRAGTHAQFAARWYGGFGVAYGNSNVLPYIKQFYVGGPNSLRGFLTRGIGPGSFRDPNLSNGSSFFDETGDIKLETNYELRFDIYRWFKGAVFADAGNVWLLRKDETRPNAEFDVSRFIKEFAVDVGAGIRLDFTYFVIRFDWAIPLRNPSLPEGDRWNVKKNIAGQYGLLKLPYGQFNLAVGYPF